MKTAEPRFERIMWGLFSSHSTLSPSLTALENVMLPLELAGRRGARVSANDALQRVGLQERTAHYPHQLSGGEKQRVAIARAYVIRPAVLFADEPTGNLDQNTGGAVADLLFEINKEAGTTLILVTHDLELASRCDRVVHMDGGRISADSSDGQRVAPKQFAESQL